MWIANSLIACYVAPMCTWHKKNCVMILLKTLLILIATTFITPAAQALNQNNTNLTKIGINKNSSSNDNRHKTNNLHTKSIASKDHENTSTTLNNTDARRNFKIFTRPDISDHSFQSLLNEYRALVRNVDINPSHDEQLKDHQNVERLQHAQGVPTMNYLNEGDIDMALQKYYAHPERYQGTTNVDNIYERFKKAFTGSFETSTMQQKFPKPSISALMTGHVPKWVTIGRQAGNNEEDDAVNRFTIPTQATTTPVNRITNVPRVSLLIDCDYNAYYCLKAFDTGSVCGRTMLMTHFTFKNYCMLDFVNCMEGAEVWIPAYMGECLLMPILSEYKEYHYTYGRWIFEYNVEDDL